MPMTMTCPCCNGVARKENHEDRYYCWCSWQSALASDFKPRVLNDHDLSRLSGKKTSYSPRS